MLQSEGVAVLHKTGSQRATHLSEQHTSPGVHFGAEGRAIVVIASALSSGGPGQENKGRPTHVLIVVTSVMKL